jgi:hypothetical protein
MTGRINSFKKWNYFEENENWYLFEVYPNHLDVAKYNKLLMNPASFKSCANKSDYIQHCV